jgi:UDP-N-acetylglucosamine acyltransferase
MPAETIRALKRAYRVLFAPAGTRDEAIARTREAYGEVPEVRRLVDFVAASTRGICR